MTKEEKLMQEFECAIYAVLGDAKEEEFDDDITAGDIQLIAQKVMFYLDL